MRKAIYFTITVLSVILLTRCASVNSKEEKIKPDEAREKKLSVDTKLNFSRKDFHFNIKIPDSIVIDNRNPVAGKAALKEKMNELVDEIYDTGTTGEGLQGVYFRVVCKEDRYVIYREENGK